MTDPDRLTWPAIRAKVMLASSWDGVTMKRSLICSVVGIGVLAWLLVPAVSPRDRAAADMGDTEWVRMRGSVGDDEGTGVARDRVGNLYFAGTTVSPPPGSSDVIGGGEDMAVVSLNANGGFRWIHTYGSADPDITSAIAVGGDGNIYVGGTTEGSLPDAANANAGGSDIAVLSYTPSGERRWVQQFGSNA